MTFHLDERLANSSFPVLSLALCDVRLKNHADYVWLILIPRVSSCVTEIAELTAEDQITLLSEITRVSAVIKKHFEIDKINIGALGNIVSQLHIHVIGRTKQDPLWPHSVWQATLTDHPYSETAHIEVITALQELLS